MTAPCNLMFRVDEASDLPIWVQLRNRVAHLIKSGKMAGGEQLPSVRSLAADAKINYNTVAKAYRDLELSGLIVSVRGRGMFVKADAAASGGETDSVDALLEDCIRQYREKGLTYREIADHIARMVDAMEQQARGGGENQGGLL